MVAIASGADTLAGALFTNLTQGLNFSLPDIDLNDPLFEQPGSTGPLYDTVEPLDFDQLTIGQVNGTGVFDKLMTSLVKHLKVEYEANRISGAEYTKAYVGIITAALQTSTQFLLSKDQAYWSALLVQSQARAADTAAVTARVDLEVARAGLARAQAEAATVEANYALTKLKLATEDINYANAELQGKQLEQQTVYLQKQSENLVQQTTNLVSQKDQIEHQTLYIDKQTDHLAQQILYVQGQITNLVEQTEYLKEQEKNLAQQTLNLKDQDIGIKYTNDKILPMQKALLQQQTAVQRAQTYDQHAGGVDVRGLIGKQKELYSQQIESYKRDSELKAAKIFADAYVTQMTVLDGITTPTQFNKDNINEVMTKLRVKNDLTVSG